jgi:hypothetical protein
MFWHRSALIRARQEQAALQKLNKIGAAGED